MIMAGGTGGHVFPALAVAEVLRQRGLAVVWLGTRQGLEAQRVPAEGFTVEWIQVRGLRGTSWKRWATAPWMVGRATLQAAVALGRHRPRVAIGMGGFVSGPGGLAARALGIPLLIHEQNARAGTTNRWLAPLAHEVLAGFPAAFPPGRRVQVVGNPVRAAIAALPPPEERFAQRTGPLRLLVLGGSQGALALNEALPAALAPLPAHLRPVVVHQTGAKGLEITRAAYAAAAVEADTSAFIDDMAAAYAWADLVVSRAGALTVAELAAAGVGAILVPYPHATDDHQRHNAQFLLDAGAARLLPQEKLGPAVLAAELAELLADRATALALAAKARRCATIDGATAIADRALALAGLNPLHPGVTTP
ncbi:MAG: undecaprenyldiphospho-muramoylpentapeptide beta-N-acetylglucosaminyltransferase [Candidatus Competibacterales bacterium]